MSDIRPVPPTIIPVKPHGPASRWRERIKVWGVKAKLAWYKSAFVIAARKNLRMTVLQLFGALSVLIGISYYSIPCALIVGGLAAIWVAERQ